MEPDTILIMRASQAQLVSTRVWKPLNSFSEARDYARSAVASKTYDSVMYLYRFCRNIQQSFPVSKTDCNYNTFFTSNQYRINITEFPQYGIMKFDSMTKTTINKYQRIFLFLHEGSLM